MADPPGQRGIPVPTSSAPTVGDAAKGDIPYPSSSGCSSGPCHVTEVGQALPSGQAQFNAGSPLPPVNYNPKGKIVKVNNASMSLVGFPPVAADTANGFGVVAALNRPPFPPPLASGPPPLPPLRPPSGYFEASPAPSGLSGSLVGPRPKVPDRPRQSTAAIRKQCNCKNSRCLKLYCECFASGKYCDNCNCVNCLNNRENEGVRQAAVEAILERNPNAFRPKIQGTEGDAVAQPSRLAVESTVPRHTKGCNCKKSTCLKKYCECFQAGIFCSDNCKCIDCKNFEGSEARAQVLANQDHTLPPVAPPITIAAPPQKRARLHPPVAVSPLVGPHQGSGPVTPHHPGAHLAVAQSMGPGPLQPTGPGGVLFLPPQMSPSLAVPIPQESTPPIRQQPPLPYAEPPTGTPPVTSKAPVAAPAPPPRNPLFEVVNGFVKRGLIEDLCKLFIAVADEEAEKVRNQQLPTSQQQDELMQDEAVGQDKEADLQDRDQGGPPGGKPLEGESAGVGQGAGGASGSDQQENPPGGGDGGAPSPVFAAQEQAVLKEFHAILQKIISAAKKKEGAGPTEVAAPGPEGSHQGEEPGPTSPNASAARMMPPVLVAAHLPTTLSPPPATRYLPVSSLPPRPVTGNMPIQPPVLATSPGGSYLHGLLPVGTARYLNMAQASGPPGKVWGAQPLVPNHPSECGDRLNTASQVTPVSCSLGPTPSGSHQVSSPVASFMPQIQQVQQLMRFGPLGPQGGLSPEQLAILTSGVLGNRPLGRFPLAPPMVAARAPQEATHQDEPSVLRDRTPVAEPMAVDGAEDGTVRTQSTVIGGLMVSQGHENVPPVSPGAEPGCAAEPLGTEEGAEGLSAQQPAPEMSLGVDGEGEKDPRVEQEAVGTLVHEHEVPPLSGSSPDQGHLGNQHVHEPETGLNGVGCGAVDARQEVDMQVMPDRTFYTSVGNKGLICGEGGDPEGI